MTEAAAGRASTGYDELWRPGRWRDEVGGEPLQGLFVGLLFFALCWNLVANLWLPGTAWVVANLAMALVLVLVARRAGLSSEELGLRRDRIGRGMAVGAVAGGVTLVALAIAVAIPASRDAFDDPEIARHASSTDAYYMLVRIPLGTVVFEEVLFRGVLMALALRRWPVGVAVVVTAACFGLWHVVPAVEGAGSGLLAVSGATLGIGAVTTAAGLLFAWLRLRANSLLAPILAHVATNSLAYLAVLVALELR